MLIISLRENDDFFVEGKRVVVTKVSGPNDFTLLIEATGKQHRITDEEATEILPDVLVSAGGYLKIAQVRIVIDAPRSIAILRGSKFRQDPDQYREQRA
ncbi:hypothetical protein [Hyphomicrobium sp. ghe19]|uniref:hypothetical protein n=1 Tax=Hyphomicrobium sp. ghe19 TaxID=2682968 RepID=UPI001366E8A2|nr:hypothetical protein HYPP_02521 [Hyphomicrobium sp. ghe19]